MNEYFFEIAIMLAELISIKIEWLKEHENEMDFGPRPSDSNLEFFSLWIFPIPAEWDPCCKTDTGFKGDSVDWGHHKDQVQISHPQGLLVSTPVNRVWHLEIWVGIKAWASASCILPPWSPYSTHGKLKSGRD